MTWASGYSIALEDVDAIGSEGPDGLADTVLNHALPPFGTCITVAIEPVLLGDGSIKGGGYFQCNPARKNQNIMVCLESPDRELSLMMTCAPPRHREKKTTARLNQVIVIPCTPGRWFVKAEGWRGAFRDQTNPTWDVTHSDTSVEVLPSDCITAEK